MRLRMGVAAALLVLAACGDEDRTQTDYTPSNDHARTSSDDGAARPAPAAPVPDTLPVKAPPQDTLPITLSPLGRATARGTGQVAASGKATVVRVMLTRTARGQTYEGAIRRGVCTAMGASIASLFPVSADSLGSGQAASDVSVPIDSLTGAPHVVVYGRGGRPEACAAIPFAADSARG
ncbi:hypothetical protein [Longimicrobium sp.]|uniref:hypothetical protein n=1 Tax=Longimicrobium sp. TaxID=2029185 RepID=UPI002E33CAD0|nr:hypothetical protein [Longimicrobium sp.]HEX6042802.1 hypothetical protein [Longimicrobium sp.]